MAQLRHYYTLRWTSRSGVNRGGKRGPGPTCISRPTVKPWPLFPLTHFSISMCPASTQTHKRPFWHIHSHTHTHSYAPPPPSPSSEQTHSIVIHVRASSCAMGAMWGAHSTKQWVGVGLASLGVAELCVGTSSLSLCLYPAPLVAPHDGSHLPTASHLMLLERLWHFELICHPPTSSLTHRMKPCWDPLLIRHRLFSLFCHLRLMINLMVIYLRCYCP